MTDARTRRDVEDRSGRVTGDLVPYLLGAVIVVLIFSRSSIAELVDANGALGT